LQGIHNFHQFPKLASPRIRGFRSALLCAEEGLSFRVLDHLTSAAAGEKLSKEIFSSDFAMQNLRTAKQFYFQTSALPQ